MKYKTLSISVELLGQFLKEPVPPGITQQGIPADAVIVGATFQEHGAIVLLIGSEQFDEDGGELVAIYSRARVRDADTAS